MDADSVFRAMTIMAALVFGFAGSSLMSMAAKIAVRRKSNVWNSARPEAGGALIFYALAIVLAANFFGWLG